MLRNDGKGKFKDVIQENLPELEYGGMVTDALWTDMNGDGRPDLIVIGEFMPIRIFINRDGKKFEEATSQYFDAQLNGFWSSIAMADFDEDGDMDFVVGNFGINSQLKANKEEPVKLIFADFDNNGSVDPFLVQFFNGTFPITFIHLHTSIHSNFHLFLDEKVTKNQGCPILFQIVAASWCLYYVQVHNLIFVRSLRVKKERISLILRELALFLNALHDLPKTISLEGRSSAKVDFPGINDFRLV